jgi:ABC-type amino acid transport substrate-binding protein
MKYRYKIIPAYIVFLLIAVMVSACGTPSTPAVVLPEVPPTATLVPTQAPAGSGDPVWDRIQAAGRISFGTSADYAPFEYYDNTYQIVGFDPALARELGSRLGLQVGFVDIAFEGLPVSLQTGQIDAAIAAISVTPSRQAIMDFTNVYYSGQDMALARQGSGIGPLIAAVQFGQYRVGVERGSVYQSWIQNSLVDAGLMSSSNLFAYEKPEHAVRDLRENRVDLVVMGLLPAEEYLKQGGLESVGKGFNTQLFGIALPKGSPVLQAKLNEALTQLQNDGTLARLSNQYLQIDTGQIMPIVTPTALPPTAVVPAPTTAPAACYDALEYVADVTIPDFTVIDPRQDFDKIWRLRNTGTCTWDSSYRFVFVQGDLMDGAPQNIRGTVRPGETYDMVIDQRAPATPGRYGGVWQLTNGQRVAFGTRVWVKITVPGNEPPPTAIPQPTPVPPVPQQPIEPPQPAITVDYFNASASSVAQGDVVTISWSFSGQGLASSRLTRTNPDGTQTPLNGGADVDLQGSYDDFMAGDPGTYTYSLSVSTEFAGTVVKTISVTVNSP